jgi:hypothetical protein
MGASASEFISLNPGIQVGAVKMDTAAMADDWQDVLRDEMLHRLLAAAQVNGGLLNVEEHRLDRGTAHPYQLLLEDGGNLPGEGLGHVSHGSGGEVRDGGGGHIEAHFSR